MSQRPFANRKVGGAVAASEKRERLRQRLFDQQDGLCHLCGTLMNLLRGRATKVGRNFATFDHVIPRAKGGTAHYSNLKLAHRRCNSARNDRPIQVSEPAL